MSTKIEWTDATWNPIRARNLETGQEGWACARVSPGCQHCYAATQNEARRFDRGTGLDYTVPNLEKVEHYLDERVLEEPLRWRKPRLVFVCSMTDLFGEWVTDEQLDRIFAVMALAQGHTFQVLTKRPERMREYLSHPAIEIRIDSAAAAIAPSNRFPWHWPLLNVWGLVSCEDQERADERVPILLDTPFAVRGVSAEPLLGPIFLGRAGALELYRPGYGPDEPVDLVRDPDFPQVEARSAGIDWVIVGGESGPRARPMDLAHARSIRDQCRFAGVPFFYKQGGSAHRCQHDAKGGHIECIPADLRIREWANGR